MAKAKAKGRASKAAPATRAGRATEARRTAPSGLARGEARPKAAPRRQRAPRAALLAPAPLRGPERYTAERFFGNCSESTAATLRRVWAAGDQLAARRVPIDGLPCVVILAAYAHANGIALVDDYEALIQRYEDNVGSCQHPDKFFASCCILLNRTGHVPSSEGFKSIAVPRLWNELIGG